MTSPTVLDGHITRCEICGDWAWDADQCKHCTEHGYPVIVNDNEAVAA